MKINKFTICLHYFLALLFALGLTTLISCEPAPKVTFINQTDQEVGTYETHVRNDGTIDRFVEEGKIPSHSTKTIPVTFLGPNWVVRIEIRDNLGNDLLSRDYNLQGIKNVGYKIIIP